MPTEATLERLTPRLIELRHRLHQIPELGYQEFKRVRVAHNVELVYLEKKSAPDHLQA